MICPICQKAMLTECPHDHHSRKVTQAPVLLLLDNEEAVERLARALRDWARVGNFPVLAHPNTWKESAEYLIAALRR